MMGYKYLIVSPLGLKVKPNIFLYKFTVWTQVPVRTPESLRIFSMGNIFVYMVHVVPPRHIVRGIPTLSGNGQSHYFPYGKSHPSCCKQVKEVLSRKLVLYSFLYESSFDVGVVIVKKLNEHI